MCQHRYVAVSPEGETSESAFPSGDTDDNNTDAILSMIS